MLYSIEEIEGGVRVKYHDGQNLCELRGGNAAVIALTFQNMSSQSEQRGDDYMAGVMAALTHSVMTRSIPDVAKL